MSRAGQVGVVFILATLALTNVVAPCGAVRAANQAHPSPATMQANSESASLAIRNGEAARARALVVVGVDPAWVDATGATLLHQAVVFSGDARLVAALLRAGTSARARDGSGETPLVAALDHAHYQHQDDAVERLLGVVDLLLAAGARLDAPDAQDRPLLHAVLQWRQPTLLTALLRRGLPLPDGALLEALAGADDANSREIAGLMLRVAGARQLAARDAQGRSPAHLAAQHPERLPLLQALAGRGADLKARDARGQSVFAAAAFAGRLPALQWLAGQGALSLQADADGQTPLHLAAYEPRIEVLCWLLAQGADPDARDRRARRALDIAIANHRFAWRSPADKLSLVQALGGDAADLRRGRFAEHPLHLAITAQDLARIESLLRQGADANVRDDAGRTPLWKALGDCAWPVSHEFGRRLLVLLLRHGADARLTSSEHEDETLLDFARALRQGELLEREMRKAPSQGLPRNR